MNGKIIFRIALFAALAYSPSAVFATSAWARKYKTSCYTCHSAFPRLNYYGERFLRNGYQDPDNEKPDGDTLKKKAINAKTFLSSVDDFFGVRLSVTPLRLKGDSLTVKGKKTDQLTMGNPDWLQLFFAGSIAKNISIFIEMEQESGKSLFNWYHLGFHNLGGSSAVNFHVGNISPRDYGGYSNRLRILPPVKAEVYAVKSANGKGEDSVDLSSARPGIQYYGYQGPVVWWLGAGPGSTPADPNDELHYWGGLRFEVTEARGSKWVGSNVSIWHYQGTDTKDIATFPTYNDFQRNSVEFNLRRGAFDLQAGYAQGKDDNWKLGATPTANDFDGISLVTAYMVTDKDGLPKIYPALQYDIVNSDDTSIETEKLTPSLTFFPRENVRPSLHLTFNLDDSSKYDYQFNIRVMF